MKYAGLDTMLRLVATEFEGKYDKGGYPYVLHCLAVMDSVRHLGYKAMMIGVGHDLLEDTDITSRDLANMNFNPIVIEGIVAMTHKEGQTYDEYLEQIVNSIFNYYTIPVKMGDLRHNMDITRLKDKRPKDFDRLIKYAKAYIMLEKQL